ncbi:MULTISPECIES: LysM peptidoglycan-binding domain-containing protein [Microbacterium]|uniref:LysM domain-containing protein n=1 Tax=Microbacterium lacticum TaxID=33885 RepID=A0A4Y3ULH3_9MICO|nr:MULTISPECIES: LysM peptidoglycan-binding domain-containing protein [Microbacterium]MCC9054768.1 LysM peptidoglycan-binding domain-containing protein [Microbacterium sp. F2E]TQM99980.1 LysM domain-containing protein [Microbacterium lacticum]GEB95012.1 peptidoglycan-binding protein LysM [Microbacterium lacticum]GGN20738.1 peptidoglycan-binding protein LysM [Microbacterium lacticum]
MTAIDFSTGTSLPAVGGAPATRLRLTVRGRRVLAFLASIPAVIALSVAIVSGGGALASGEGSAPAGTFAEVTVMPGDTLWSIAEEAAPGADPRDVVDAIVRLNALPSGALAVGQTLALPAEYSAGQ